MYPFLKHFCYLPGLFLAVKLDEWVSAFDAEEERKEKHKNASMAEDGWTVVVRSKVIC
jgi:hypothetical protein